MTLFFLIFGLISNLRNTSLSILFKAFDKKKRTLSLSLDFMEQSYVPDLKKIQEEHIKQWKKILADQITGLQTNTEISRFIKITILPNIEVVIYV